MRPLRCQPHPLYRPRPGQKSIRYSLVAGWWLRDSYPLPEEKGAPWPKAEPEEPPTDAQVALWREKYAATCSDKVARLLTALERDYALTGPATARSGPTAA